MNKTLPIVLLLFSQSAFALYSKDGKVAIFATTSQVVTPAAQLHIDAGTGSAVAAKFTAGTTTGQTATDGFDVGISTAGNAELRQRENLPLTAYTNNTARLTIGATGSIAFNAFTTADPLRVDSSGNVVPSRIDASTEVANTLPVVNGGTGQTSYTDGQLLIGNSSTGGLSKATITQGSNITVTNGNGTITIASTGGGGTVHAWAGYFGSDCGGWSLTSASFTAFSADATCTLNEAVNTNFGTVTKSGGASTLPGITFTPISGQNYKVCFTAALNLSAVNKAPGLRIRDTTNSITVIDTEAFIPTALTTAYDPNMEICGIWQAPSSSATTIDLQGLLSGSGTLSIGTWSETTNILAISIFGIN